MFAWLIHLVRQALAEQTHQRSACSELQYGPDWTEDFLLAHLNADGGWYYEHRLWRGRDKG